VGEEERRGEAEGKECFEMAGRRGLPLPACPWSPTSWRHQPMRMCDAVHMILRSLTSRLEGCKGAGVSSRQRFKNRVRLNDSFL
jgi:hypothetical protein